MKRRRKEVPSDEILERQFKIQERKSEIATISLQYEAQNKHDRKTC